MSIETVKHVLDMVIFFAVMGSLVFALTVASGTAPFASSSPEICFPWVMR